MESGIWRANLRLGWQRLPIANLTPQPPHPFLGRITLLGLKSTCLTLPPILSDMMVQRETCEAEPMSCGLGASVRQ